MNSQFASKVACVAAQLVGIPYKRFGRDYKEGLDCYGLVLEFYKRLGYPIAIDSGAISPQVDSDFVFIGAPVPGALVEVGIGGVPTHVLVAINRTEALEASVGEVSHIVKLSIYGACPKILGYYKRVGVDDNPD